MMFLSEIRSLPESDRAEAYQAWLNARGEGYRTDSLSNRISAGVELSESDIDSLMAVLGNRCHGATKRRLRSVLGWLSNVDNISTLDRVIKGKHGWEYCAGQSYTDEIRRLRKHLIG